MKKYTQNTELLSKINVSCNNIIQMDNITSKDIEMSTNHMIKELDNCIKLNYNKKELNQYKKDDLIHIINNKTSIKIKGKKRKSDLIKLILKYQKNENCQVENNKIALQLLGNFKEIEMEVESYKNRCSTYLKHVDETLDKSVYGMTDAKMQIKRVIAQWINGTNQGYIFGFEGSPGTGKTTLAKQGIAKCIQDGEGNTIINNDVGHALLSGGASKIYSILK